MAETGLFVITGASRGIGAAIARLAAASYPVVALYRSDTARAEALASTIRAEGGRVHLIRADVGSEADLLRAFEEIDALGRIEVLVNNAGITGGVARVQDLRADTLDDVLRVNVAGAFLGAREAVRRMSTRQGGQGGNIINISSGAATLGAPGTWVHYAATKGAIDTFTIGLAKEVAAEGIRVNAVRPGLIDTDIHQARTPAQLQAMAAAIPLGRMGQANDIAQAVLWLASPAASYVTGSLVDVRGGF
jgi:NAD(P)-dependent dehydrogenase (short-subunit alcohol dehydrogenase family)